MIDLARLRHIILVAREGSFGRAAQAANLSQPALSRSVQATERQYGIKIFDRSRTGVILTPAGIEFLSLAEDFVLRAEALETDLHVAGSAGGGVVSFGLGPLGAMLFLVELSDMLFQRDIRAVVRVENEPTLRRLLVDGEIAFYIGGSWRGANEFAVASRLRMDYVGTARYGMFAREGHPLAELTTISAAQLARFPVVGGSPIRRILDDQVLATVGLRQPSIEIDNYPLLVEIARRSDAILLASPFLTQSSWGHGLVRINVDLPEDHATLAACLVTLEGRTMSPTAELVADHVVSLLRGVVAG